MLSTSSHSIFDTVQYSPGKSLVLADALSRNPEKDSWSANIIEEDTSDFVVATVRSLPASNDMLLKVRTEQENDPVFRTIKKYCSNKWSSKNQIPTSLAEYDVLEHHFLIGDDLQLYDSRLVITRSLQEELLLRLHGTNLFMKNYRIIRKLRI